MEKLYSNNFYINNRNRRKTLILDVKDNNDNVFNPDTGFNISLYEPLKIDKQSEIFLDNFTTYNSNITVTDSQSAFVLKINEFNINTNIASNSNENGNLSGSIIIPNEHKDPNNFHSAVIHKAKKFNYICDLNPGTIDKISGRVTDLDGFSVFSGNSDHFHTYSLTGIEQDLTATNDSSFFPLLPTDVISGITLTGGTNIPGSVGNINGVILAITPNDPSTLHFALNQDLRDSDNSLQYFTGNTSIAFTITRQGVTPNETITLSNASGENNNLHLIHGQGRFIAEFSIVSKE
tara:strand:- start:1624 stop:2499 length:876 start_codon:yes stop_codon:yes gene_type:complete